MDASPLLHAFCEVCFRYATVVADLIASPPLSCIAEFEGTSAHPCKAGQEQAALQRISAAINQEFLLARCSRV